MNDFAKRLYHDLEKEDPEVEFRIKTGTEMYRKGFARFLLKDAGGNEIKGAKIKVRQISHEYLFGANAFMLNQFPEAEQNRKFEEVFAKLFNEAVVPFYWSDFEPEKGNCRFASGSRPIYRRPPSDEVLAFCEKNGIAPKGHPLCWHCFVPDWVPNDYPSMMWALDRRVKTLAEHYSDRIFWWDCVNEAQSRNPLTRESGPAFPDDHVERMFRLTDRYFPNASLIYNDDRRWWNLQGDYTPVYLLVRQLLDRGCRVGGLGLQFHMFDGFLHENGDYRSFLNPRFLFRILDQYGKLNVPVNFSEVSIVSRRDLGDGDRFQELVTEKLYRLWFSHPATNSIVWWNPVDGTAAYAPLGSEQGENSLRAGLLNYDFTPKPAWRALDRLINREWHTETAFEYRAGAENMFHGFYGNYEVEVGTDSGTFRKTVFLTKNGNNNFVLNLK